MIGLALNFAVNQLPFPESWQRRNFRGAQVSLGGGCALAAGLIADSRAIPVAAAALGGFIDDHYEFAFAVQSKGYRGHLGALAKGKVSSGALKVLLIGSGALWKRKPTDAAIIALSANFFNLLDLRPGRARKVGLALGLLRGNRAGAVAAMHCALGMGPDLAGKTMLGDMGANALGAQVGLAYTEGSSALRYATLATLLGLNLAAEKVSFSKVIAGNAVLKYLDELGTK